MPVPVGAGRCRSGPVGAGLGRSVPVIQWNSKKAEFRVKFEFLKPRLETRLEKLDFSSKLDLKLDSKNSIFRVYLLETRLEKPDFSSFFNRVSS